MKSLSISLKNIIAFDKLFQAFAKYKTLEKLSLYFTHTFNLNSGDFSHFKNCLNLNYLLLNLYDLNDEQLTDIELYLPNLVTFYSVCNELSDQSLNSLTKLKNLKEIKIISNKISDSGLSDFRNKSPKICIPSRLYFPL